MATGFWISMSATPGMWDSGDRENELFINNGDLTFTEKAKEYNLNNNGLSVMLRFSTMTVMEILIALSLIISLQIPPELNSTKRSGKIYCGGR